MNNSLYISRYCTIKNNTIVVDGKEVFADEISVPVNEFLKNAYRSCNVQYAKFFKMDALCKLGFLTAELLLQNYDSILLLSPEKIGVVLANSSSSLDTDINYFDTIKDREHYFPSPAVFVYTLPNIVIGEICIRHKLNGENAFFVSQSFDAELLYNNVKNMFEFGNAQCIIMGWVELLGDTYQSILYTIERTKHDIVANKNNIFDTQNLLNLYQNGYNAGTN